MRHPAQRPRCTLWVLLCCAIAVPATAAELPTCASDDAVPLLEQLISASSLGEGMTGIDGHREVGYDAEANLRTCRCVVHSARGDQEMEYRIDWGDEGEGVFNVRVPGANLPSATSPEVVQVLEQVIRSSPNGAHVRTLDGHREIEGAGGPEHRIGVCVAHTDTRPLNLRYQVEWQDRTTGMFQVRVVGMEAPTVDDADVIQVLAQVIAERYGPGVQAIEGHRQVRFDEVADRRLGACEVRIEDGEVEVHYVVEWQDRNQGYFEVWLPPTEVPEVDHPAVLDVLEDLLRNRFGDAFVGVEGHREVGFDREIQQRFGECVVQATTGPVETGYRVEWRDAAFGQFLVRLSDGPPEG